MKHLLIILSLFLFSFTVISCSDEKEDSTENSGTTTTTTDDTTKFVGVGESGTIVRSTDNGSTWDNATSPTANNLLQVVFGNNTLVAGGTYGNIVTTNSGINWANATSPTAYHLWGVTFGNDTFVTVGESGYIIRSTDNGTNWDNVTSPHSDLPSRNQPPFSGVTFGNNTFVGVGEVNGNVFISIDNGSSFSDVTESTNNYLLDVTFSE